MLETCEILNIDDTLIPRWKHVLENLTDYSKDGDVFRIGRDLKYEMSHRHYSHLFAFFPLHLLDPATDAKLYDMMKKSMDHWLSIEGNLLGYTWTGSSAMAATMQEGNLALKYLNGLKYFLTSNTMYIENGPVIETPLASAESVHYMLLQSWGDTIRVFTATPDDWQDISFNNLRAEGAFLISGSRKNGTTEYVHVQSLAGQPCRIKTDIEGDIIVTSDDNV